MSHQPQRASYLIVSAALVAVLALILVYLYGLAVRLPYIGFDWSTADGQIHRIHTPRNTLRLGDQLVQVNDLTYEKFQSDLRRPLFDYSAEPGQILHLTVRRDSTLIPVEWPLPGRTANEFSDRLTSQWWLAAIFWLVGAAVTLLVRPRDDRWQTLAAFNFVTAAWLMASSLSHFHLWSSAPLLYGTLWLAVPVYWRLAWIVPTPLAQLPRWTWPGLFTAATLLGAAEWFQVVPDFVGVLALILALGGSLAIALVRFVAQPQQRRAIWVSLAGTLLAFIPAIGFALAAAVTDVHAPAALALVALPLLPLTYLYAAYRQRLGGLELRVNRVVTLFVYLILFGTALIIALSLLDQWVTAEGESVMLGAGAGVLAAALTVATFRPFQRFVERRLLGMPVPPEELLQRFAERISASPDRAGLEQSLRREVLPSLLVRESALLHYNLTQTADVLFTTDAALRLPLEAGARPGLAAAAGRYLPPDGEPLPAAPWVRLVVPLAADGETAGVWLFGRRDPDDFYSRRDIQFLQTLAQQTGVALANIIQAESLQALYRGDIDRVEEERRHVAHELHDHVLSRLAQLKLGPQHTPETDAVLDEVIERLRDTVSGLRPAMLEFGLCAAVRSLADEDAAPPIVVELPPSEVRYGEAVELHLYRIVQQACENARQHARARQIRVGGRCDADAVALVVEDDGLGLPAGAQHQLASMVAQRHFGLAGMVERAALVGARVDFDSAPGRGTRVRVTWRRTAP